MNIIQIGVPFSDLQMVHSQAILRQVLVRLDHLKWIFHVGLGSGGVYVNRIVGKHPFLSFNFYYHKDSIYAAGYEFPMSDPNHFERLGECIVHQLWDECWTSKDSEQIRYNLYSYLQFQDLYFNKEHQYALVLVPQTAQKWTELLDGCTQICSQREVDELLQESDSSHS